MSGRRGLVERALTVVSGALPVLAFPQPAWWWWAHVALVPWLLLVRNSAGAREAALRGWLGGAGFVLAVHHWLLPVTTWFMPLVAAVLGLLWLPWGVLVRRALRRPVTAGSALVALVVVPAGWVVVELVRSWQQLGGPWALLGASQAPVPPALTLASLGGVWLVSFAVVGVNVAVVVAATPGVRGLALAAVAVVLAGTLTWDAVRSPLPADGHVRVAAVQPSTVAGATDRVRAGTALTEPLAGRDVDLVVWGESSVPLSLESRPDVLSGLAGLASRVGAPVLVNVDARRPGGTGIFKTSVLVGPDGARARYDKTRLVPFGEYVPARGLLGWVAGVTDAAAEDRRRGRGVVVMDAGAVRVGPLVCFESAFPDLTRTLARGGAELVVVQSSTWTFQNSWAPQQHAALAAVRAAESGRPVVHSTLTGQTVAYDHTGARLGGTLTTRQTGVLVVDVPVVSGSTPYAVAGDWVPAASVLVLLVAVVGWVARRVARRVAGSPLGGRRRVQTTTRTVAS